jgi:Mu-like prophage major head subunit gpT
MDQSILSSRAVLGMYFLRMENNPGLPWINAVSNLFTSDQAVEQYAFLGFSPMMREWIGGRQAKGLTGNAFQIANRHYEATLEVSVRDLRRDKTGQLQARINEFADRSQTHWATLVSGLLVGAEATICYDGQYYFDTDHVEGDSGVQSNKIDVSLATLPAVVHGSVATPSKEEMQQAIIKGIAQIMSFKASDGEPMNENARAFQVIVPLALWPIAVAATSFAVTDVMPNNLNPNAFGGLSIAVHMNPRLTAADKFLIFRADSALKGLIRQEETGISIKAKAEGSEYEFDNDAHQYGIDTWRSVGFGFWQHALQVRLVA